MWNIFDGRLDRHEFREWLLSLEPDQSAGIPQLSDDCPIATFIKIVHGPFALVDVANDEIFGWREGEADEAARITTPVWARTFINTIDEYPDNEITASKVLDVLDALPATPRLPKVGDPIRVTSTPSHVHNQDGKDEDELIVDEVFRRCVGCVFPVISFNGEIACLEVGEVMGKEKYAHTIWLEPECFEPAEPKEQLPPAYPMGAGEI